MSNTTGTVYANTTDNYLGPLFVLGANQTPFLSMMGGMRGYKSTPVFEFPMEQYVSLESGAQRVVTEANAVTGTATQRTYVKAQLTNTLQMGYYPIEVSYAKATERQRIAGITYLDPAEVMQDELQFQTQMTLRQMAVDLEVSCLRGTYATKATSASSAATRGICTAVQAATTTLEDAASGALTKAMVDSVSKKMADAGAPMTSPVIFAGSFQMQALSDLYGWSPVGGAGAGLGGVRVNRLMTQFFEADVVFAPYMNADEILIADMDKCMLKGGEVPGKGAIVLEPKGKVGAADAWQLYYQLGMDYSDPTFHGLINALSTS